MSLLDDIVGQVSESATVQNLAAKVGLTPEQIGTAIAALAQAHGEDGDTVRTASAATGISADKLDEIVDHIGGEGALGRFASILGSESALSASLGSLSKLL